MAHIVFTDSSSEVTSTPLILLQQEVIKAYFAEMKTEEISNEGVSTETESYTVAAGDVLSTIASNKETTIAKLIEINDSITAATINDLQIGQVIHVPKKNLAKKVTFSPIDSAKMGQDVYIVVETKHLEMETILINIIQGKAEVLAKKDEIISVTVDGNEVSLIETSVGNISSDETISNREDFINWAVVKVKLKPTSEELIKKWNDGLSAILTNGEAYLSILVDAHSKHSLADFKSYYVDYKGYTGEKDDSKIPNQFLNQEEEWFVITKCDCCFETIDANGLITHDKIVKNRVTSLEHGALTNVNAIVLHRTANSSAAQTITSFAGGIGTHFLVALDGTITQTASLNQLTYHVGKIKSRCFAEGTCTPEDQTIIAGFGWAPTTIYNHEKQKSYPDRYPYNIDSIGIEVVGSHISGSTWQAIPDVQKESVTCLVDGLLKHFGLSKSDIFVHEAISYKTAGEGQTVYDAIINELQQ